MKQEHAIRNDVGRCHPSFGSKVVPRPLQWSELVAVYPTHGYDWFNSHDLRLKQENHLTRSLCPHFQAHPAVYCWQLAWRLLYRKRQVRTIMTHFICMTGVVFLYKSRRWHSDLIYKPITFDQSKSFSRIGCAGCIEFWAIKAGGRPRPQGGLDTSGISWGLWVCRLVYASLSNFTPYP